MPYLIGVDIGGTFTDAAAIEVDSGAVLTAKARTTPTDLNQGVCDALMGVAEAAGLQLERLLNEATKFAHGTTQTSNVMFTWSGARTGLLATRGFGDELLIMRARGRVAGLGLAERRHFRATDKPHRVVPSHLIEEVAERVDHHGEPIVPLTREEAERAVGRLVDLGVESIAISLLWSHENPAHERLLEAVIRDRAPEVYVSSSHTVAPVLGEYERTATTAVNAYVGPAVVDYLNGLDAQLSGMGLREPVMIVQADGGVVRADKATPVATIESGPAAGMVAVREVARNTDRRNVIATDVGGTTFKVGLLVDGEWTYATETIINQYTLQIPMIDLVSIGAGGGSVAWVDDTRLRVGPESAGATPGPACYGAGGGRPTVTDADLVLGFLDPDRFLGGRLRLDREAAEAAIATQIADPLFAGDVASAAAGIREVVDAQMAGLVRRTTIERGFDPREFVLMSYGGAGPLHAASYARGLGISEILIPGSATVHSAYGAAISDLQVFAQRSVSRAEGSGSRLMDIFRELEEDARSALAGQGAGMDSVMIRRWADMRYERQLHDVRIDAATDVATTSLREWMDGEFERRYVELYGRGAVLPNTRTRVLGLGVTAVSPSPERAIERLPPGPSDPAGAEIGGRPVYWPEAHDWIPTRVYDGALFAAGDAVVGPAVIHHWGTTIAVPGDAKASIDEFGNTVIVL
jgi:N-methylhydantoinase A